MKIRDYKELEKLRVDYEKLSKDYEKAINKLCEKDLLIDELRNYIECLEEDNRSVYGLKTQIELLEEERIVYEDRIENLKLANNDFKRAYSIVKNELEEATKAVITLKLEVASKNNIINSANDSNDCFINELKERDYKEGYIRAKVEEAVEGLKELLDNI